VEQMEEQGKQEK